MLEELKIFKDSGKVEEDLWNFNLIKDGKIVQKSLTPLPRENILLLAEELKKKNPDLILLDE